MTALALVVGEARRRRRRLDRRPRARRRRPSSRSPCSRCAGRWRRTLGEARARGVRGARRPRRRRLRRPGRRARRGRDRGRARLHGAVAEPALGLPRPGRRGVVALACVATLVALLLGLAGAARRDGLAGSRRSSTRWCGRDRSCSAAGTSCCRSSTRPSSSPAGSGSRSSSPATGSCRRCPGRSSRSRPTSGRSRDPTPNGVAGAALALVAIFLPSFLLLAGLLPLWSLVRTAPIVQAAVVGVGAAVVGLLAAALWDPVLTTSIDGVGDVAFALGLLVLLRLLPIWAVVAARGRARRAPALARAQVVSATAGQLPVSHSESFGAGIGWPK